jgi:hypothetical protein
LGGEKEESNEKAYVGSSASKSLLSYWARAMITIRKKKRIKEDNGNM